MSLCIIAPHIRGALCRHAPFRRAESIRAFFKALLYEEYRADMSPSDDPMFRWNPFTFFIALLYEEYYADMSPSDESLVSLESRDRLKGTCLHNTPHIREL